MYAYVARQPILNQQQKTVGYELLFRDGEHNAFPDIETNVATSRLIIENYFANADNPIVSVGRSFINFPQQSIEELVPTLLPKEKVVIEILETCQPTPTLFKAVQRLHAMGYILALDDFVPDSEWQRFFPYVHIIKLDLNQVSEAQCGDFIERCKGKRIKFLAEKVETHQQFERCKALGFHFFQGYYFSKPELIKRKQLNSMQVSTIQVLHELCRPSIDFDRIEQIVSGDLSLSYQLLRYVNDNSPASQEIVSFKQALVYLGEEKLKQFISVATTAYAAQNKPNELYLQSILRARMSEALLQASSFPTLANQAFLSGLFSRLDSLLDTSIEDVIEALPLATQVKVALLERKGELGAVLRLIDAYEVADWSEVDRCGKILSVSAHQISQAYHQAVRWSLRQKPTS